MAEPNPFLKTGAKPVADDGDAEPSREEKVLAALEGDDDDKGDEGEDANVLFGDDKPEDSDDPLEDEDLFDEDDKKPEVPKGWTESTYKRFKQVIGQRNDGRKTIDALTKAGEANKELAGVFSEKYGSFDNPAAIARFDADFMSAVETLSKTDVNIAQFADTIKNFQQTGRAPAVTTSTTPAPVADPKPDVRVTKIIESNARRDVDAVLTDINVKSSFRKLIADHIVSGDADLTTLDRASVVKLAKGFIAEKGFTSKDVLEPVKDGAKKTTKPATSRQSGVATVERRTQAKPDSDASSRPDAPKTREEWIENRDTALREMFEEN